MSDIKVSVIIPVYNTAKYLKKCLDSLVNQTLKEIEIICVDDGSKDNSLEILNEYKEKDNRIIVITQPNQGQSKARNVGLELAKGEYIGFIDSDDWIDLNYFEKLYTTAKKHSAEIAICSLKRIYPHKQYWRIHVTEEKVIEDSLEKYNFAKIPKQCYPVNKIYLKEKLDEFNLKFPEGKFFEDMAFTPRAVHYLKKMVTVPDTVYWYWGNMKSTVKAKTNKKMEDLISAWADFRAFTRENNIQCDEVYYVKYKYKYTFLGIPILKIYEWETISKYYLFGFIKFMERHKYTS